MPRMPLGVSTQNLVNRVSPDQTAQKAEFERGLWFLKNGQPNEAYRCFQTVLSVNPHNLPTLKNIARISLSRREAKPALAYLTRALKASPRDAQVHAMLGEAHICEEDYDEAIKELKEAIKIDGRNLDAHVSLARCYSEKLNIKKAKGYYQKAIELSPDNIFILNKFSAFLLQIGSVNEAIECYNRIMEINPDDMDALYSLAKTRYAQDDESLDDKILSYIDARLSRDNIENLDRVKLEYHAGEILNDQGKYEAAIERFVEANRVSAAPFDIERHTRYYDALIEVFGDAFFTSRGDIGFHTDRPVFIVGMPRSGTTLTEQICAGHPDIYGAGELPLLYEMARKMGLMPVSYTQFLANLGKMDRRTARAYGREYVERSSSNATDQMRVIDKMPHNFELLGLISLILPDARILHCRRDPMDTCLSIFTKSFGVAHSYKNDMGVLGLYYRQYHRLMEHWKAVLPLKILDVQYEDMVNDTEGKAREIMEFLDVEWNDACLNFQATERIVRTASVRQVRQPVYTSSVRRWKRYGATLDPLRDALGDLAEAGGD